MSNVMVRGERGRNDAEVRGVVDLFRLLQLGSIRMKAESEN